MTLFTKGSYHCSAFVWKLFSPFFVNKSNVFVLNRRKVLAHAQPWSRPERARHAVVGWGRWWQGVVYRWLHRGRGEGGGGGSVSQLPPARGEQPLKIYKYRVVYFIFFPLGKFYSLSGSIAECLSWS